MTVLAGTIGLSLQDPDRSTTGERSMAGTEADMDGLLATWLLVGGNNEIALAEVAAQRAQDPAVKRFAEMMIEDHRPLGDSLQAFALPEAHREGGDEVSDAARERERDDEAGGERDGSDEESPNVREASSSRNGSQVALLVQELGDQGQESSRSVLKQKEGREFDRCYMGMAVAAHQRTKDTLVVFRRHASPELESLLADGEKVVTRHLERAKDLQIRLDARPSDRRDETESADHK